MQSRLQNIFIIVFLSLSTFDSLSTEKAKTDYHSINDPTCQLSLKKMDTDDKKYNKIFYSKLKERNYKLNESDKVIPGRLYLLSDKSRIGHGLYKDCSVQLVLKRAENNFKSKKDKIIDQRKVKRKYPRITRQGDERCRRALKEAFINIPTCKIPGQ